MHRSLIALCATFACLALAAPASAQEPTPGATIDVTVTCDSSNNAQFRVLVSGLSPNESAGYMVVNADGEIVSTATATDTTDETGSHEAGFGASYERGTYTVYAYTGPYQTIPAGSSWPGSIVVDSFHPELTTSWVSTQAEVTCGPPTKEECKFGGFADSGYRNQGQCVSANAPGRQ